MRKRSNRSAAARALAAAALLAGLVPSGAGPASAQDAAPRFSSPLDVMNEFHPFVPGAVKVFGGVEDGRASMTVETHTDATRDFAWDGGTVTCRVVERLEFRRGAIVSRERMYVAQDDAGGVWSFGETEEDDPVDDSAEDADEPDGWIVGARTPADPPDVVEASAPVLLMPGSPQVGATWRTEDVPPDFVTSARVVGAELAVRVPSGRHSGCVRIRETDLTDGTAELRWYAPGVGAVRARARGERLVLQASTIRPRR